MSGLFVIVDDQDPNIHFSPGWGTAPAAISFEYGGTITGPGPQGSTAHYSFNGERTSISVFSRIAANPNKTTTTLSFMIDDRFLNTTVIQTDQNEHFHQELFSSPTLPDGSHTLDITLTNITSNDVFLDYFIYEASQNSTLATSPRLLVLNTSPHLAYSQGWSSGIVLRPGLAESAVSLNSSVQGAADVGATLAFNFIVGTGFEVHGLLAMAFPSPVASYSLDGAPFANVQMPVNGTSFNDDVSNFVFIGQTFDEVGIHSLVITPLIPGAFFLDYIIVQSPTAFLPPKADVAVLPKTTTSVNGSETSSTTTARVTPSPVSAGVEPGVIAGIAVGIVAFLAISGLAWYLLRRRCRRKIASGPQSQGDGSSTTMTGRLRAFSLRNLP
ncbi:hypothetical protein C8R44DRAFT_608380 [Mycena epipterygia]|nr:hypothetical protein C8R44DRAFT_608380 [Mycena epipterygia]